MHLGGISGIETRRRLAELDPSIPVIFITGDGTAASRKEARDAGLHCLPSKTRFRIYINS